MVAPRWIVWYGTAFSEGFQVEVSLFGRVTGCNVPTLNKMIGLSDTERMQKMDAFMQQKTKKEQ